MAPRPYREYAILDKGVGSVPDFDGPVPDTRDPLLPLLGLLSLFGRARCVPCAPQGGVTGCGEALLGAGRRYWVQGGSNYRGREVWSWRQGVSVAPT